MIQIGYRLDPTSSVKVNAKNLIDARSEQLHYDYFLGDIIIKIEDKDISANWGWVPVLDFFICIINIIEGIKVVYENIFEFTESDSSIKFRYMNGAIYIKCNYGEYGGVEIEIDYDIFNKELQNAFRVFLDDIKTIYTSIDENEYIKNLFVKYSIEYK